MRTLEEGVKSMFQVNNKHQNNINDVHLVSLLLLFHTSIFNS